LDLVFKLNSANVAGEMKSLPLHPIVEEAHSPVRQEKIPLVSEQ
jgi:hypothetical protein